MFRIIIISFVTLLSHFSVNENPIDVSINMQNKSPKTIEDLVLEVRIKSNSNNVVIPKHISYGFIQDTTGLLSLQLQKRKNGIYVNVNRHGVIDDIPYEQILDTLQISDIRTDEFSFGGVYHIFKGEYRIRLLGNFIIKNHWKEIYSNWFYFYANKEIFP